MNLVQIRDVALHTEVAGEGPAFIWGHGLTSSIESEDAFGLFDFDRLRTRARIVRYDARGHGRSESTAALDAYSWEALAHDQLALADHLALDSYIAGGASMGCATALHAAVIAPDRISGLLLVIPPTAWETRAAQVDSYAVMAAMVEEGRREQLVKAAALRPPPDPFVADPRWKDRFSDMLASNDPERVARIFRGAGTADLPPPEAIATVEVPALILAWTGDDGHPASTAAKLQELMPHAELALAATAAGVASWTDRAAAFLGQF